MSRLDTFRNVLVVVLLSLAVLPACSTQGPRQTQEQEQTANRPTRSAPETNRALETAGGVTLAVIVLGIGAAVAAVPLLLIFLL